MSCTQNCNQGRECSCCRANFDAVGRPAIASTPVWLQADAVIAAIAVAVAAALISGVL